MWWLLVHGKCVRVDDTTYFGLASSLSAHSRIARGASSSPRPGVGPPALALMFGPDILAHLELLFPVAGSVACTALAYYGNAVLTAVRRVAWTMVAALAAVAGGLVGF